MATSGCRGSPRALCQSTVFSCIRDGILFYKFFPCNKRQTLKGSTCEIQSPDGTSPCALKETYGIQASRSYLYRAFYQVIWENISNDMKPTHHSSKFLTQSVHIPTVSKFYLIQDRQTDRNSTRDSSTGLSVLSPSALTPLLATRCPPLLVKFPCCAPK
jgi:hypothetical protein